MMLQFITSKMLKVPLLWDNLGGYIFLLFTGKLASWVLSSLIGKIYFIENKESGVRIT